MVHVMINHPNYKSAEWWKHKCLKEAGKEPEFRILWGFRWRSTIELPSRKKDISLDER